MKTSNFKLRDSNKYQALNSNGLNFGLWYLNFTFERNV